MVMMELYFEDDMGLVHLNSDEPVILSDYIQFYKFTLTITVVNWNVKFTKQRFIKIVLIEMSGLHCRVTHLNIIKY